MIHVSIPHWFSLNSSLQDSQAIAPTFPSHIGSRSTKRQRGTVSHPQKVSIPHWFSLNLQRRTRSQFSCTGFHPTLVLAQLDTDIFVSQDILFPSHIGSRSTILLSKKAKEGKRVSIPHWFSLNAAIEVREDGLYLFPSHIGSRSTKQIPGGYWSGKGFHPTLVLAQQHRRAGLCICKASFHPTLVLAQRVQEHEVARSLHRVSIPHWFSLNRRG